MVVEPGGCVGVEEAAVALVAFLGALDALAPEGGDGGGHAL